jgi:hypothetical protein
VVTSVVGLLTLDEVPVAEIEGENDDDELDSDDGAFEEITETGDNNVGTEEEEEEEGNVGALVVAVGTCFTAVGFMVETGELDDTGAFVEAG